MSGSSPKRKGDGYERELAKYFNEKVFGGDDLVQRMPLSGGGAIKSSGGSDLKNTLGFSHIKGGSHTRGIKLYDQHADTHWAGPLVSRLIFFYTNFYRRAFG